MQKNASYHGAVLTLIHPIVNKRLSPGGNKNVDKNPCQRSSNYLVASCAAVKEAFRHIMMSSTTPEFEHLQIKTRIKRYNNCNALNEDELENVAQEACGCLVFV